MLERDELRFKVNPQTPNEEQRKFYVQAITRIVTAQNEFFQKEKESENYVLGASNNWFLHWDFAKHEFVLTHRYGGIKNKLEILCLYVYILYALGLTQRNPAYFKEVCERIPVLISP